MEEPICASCPNRSTQRTTITCGSCQRRWHALCVRVPAKKARELQAEGAVWHCRDCLGRGPSATLKLTQTSPSPSDFPEALARLRREGRIVSRLPKSVRPLVADALAEALDEALQFDTADRWWELLTFVYRKMQAPAPGSHSTAAACIRRQISGEVLVGDASDSGTGRGDRRGRQQRADRGDEAARDDALVRRIAGKLADGDIRAALQALTTDEEFAPPDHEIVTALRAKHPPAPDDQLLPPPPTNTDPAPLTASEADVEAAITSMQSGSAAGLDGIRALHLQQLVSREAAESGRRLIRSLTRLTNLLLQGAAPQCAREALFGATLCAITKRDGGLRPIAVGSIYRRLACRIAARHVTAAVGEKLRPIQLGVGTPQGCEAAVHATREFLTVAASATTPHLLVKVDIRNAFNTVRRDVFLTQARTRVPAVYPMLRNMYGEPTPLLIGGQTIASCSGVQQGDPLGPAAFALALDPVIRTMQSPLNVWYLDDGTIGGPAEQVAADLAVLAEVLPTIGLELNTKKCEVAFSGPVPSLPLRTSLHTTLPELVETQPNELTLLGSPLTEAALPAATNRAAATIKRMCSRISRLDAHTGLFLLVHFTAAPRLTYLLRSAPLYREQGPLLSVDRAVRETLSAVTNTVIDDEAWEQASLPLRFGGLGVRPVTELALPCHLASLHACLPLTQDILHSPESCELTPALQRARADAATKLGGATQLIPPSESHKQRAWDETFARISRQRLLEGANQVTRARLLAAAEPQTAAWVQVLPVPSLGLHLDNDTVRVAVALRLGAAVCEPHLCKLCRRPVDRPWALLRQKCRPPLASRQP